ncbi:hypothetical protein Cfor_05421 [Coptotermes formosanus]|uniref:Uncharacterized protein n=1 Tax=Coptotermes formosanus TaxID=36987 RepID=A0A6L2Q0C1_COPFO|nr:hypothetical protein Cfor_05421 [Coptotermes formosanus]
MRARVDDSELNFNVSEGIKLVLMIGDIRLKEEQTGVAGDVFILDASIATPAQFAKFTPALLKKLFVCIQVSDKLEYSPRLGGHILFSPF